MGYSKEKVDRLIRIAKRIVEATVWEPRYADFDELEAAVEALEEEGAEDES